MLIDTNVLIAYLNGEEEVIRTLTEWKLSTSLLISSINRAEILSRPNLTADEIRFILSFLKSFVSISFTDTLADLAAELRRHYRLSLPDAAIAATAIYNGVPLVTRDVQDFQKIKQLSIVTI